VDFAGVPASAVELLVEAGHLSLSLELSAWEVSAADLASAIPSSDSLWVREVP
jgi:hypothetical protein